MNVELLSLLAMIIVSVNGAEKFQLIESNREHRGKTSKLRCAKCQRHKYFQLIELYHWRWIRKEITIDACISHGIIAMHSTSTAVTLRELWQWVRLFDSKKKIDNIIRHLCNWFEMGKNSMNQQHKTHTHLDKKMSSKKKKERRNNIQQKISKYTYFSISLPSTR